MTCTMEVTDLISKMDEESLRRLLLQITLSLGEERSTELVEEASCMEVRTDRESVIGVVSDMLEDADDRFLHGPCDGLMSECGSIEEYAVRVIEDSFRDVCKGDITILVGSGRSDDAMTYLSVVSEMLSDARCAVTEHVPGCCRSMCELIDGCVSDMDPMGVFYRFA